VSNLKTAERPQLGEILRGLRLERGLELADAAAELGVPAKSLRAVEWDRPDLLRGNGAGELIEHRYAAFLGLELERPAVAAAGTQTAVAEAPRPSRDVSLSEWLAPLAALGPPFVIALPFFFEDVPVPTFVLLFLSSLLLFGAALPQGVLSRFRVSSASFARYREPMGLAALGILVPVALFSVLGAVV
jgi:transcriptional regulator with XRE-family HTH domain